MEKFLRNVADEDRTVVALSVNKGYLEFALNWACSISTLNPPVTNYFFIASDRDSFEYLRQRGHPVFLLEKYTRKVRQQQ